MSNMFLNITHVWYIFGMIFLAQRLPFFSMLKQGQIPGYTRQRQILRTQKSPYKSSLISSGVPFRDLHGTIEGPSFGMEIQIWHGRPNGKKWPFRGGSFFGRKKRHPVGGWKGAS